MSDTPSGQHWAEHPLAGAGTGALAQLVAAAGTAPSGARLAAAGHSLAGSAGGFGAGTLARLALMATLPQKARPESRLLFAHAGSVPFAVGGELAARALYRRMLPEGGARRHLERTDSGGLLPYLARQGLPLAGGGLGAYHGPVATLAGRALGSAAGELAAHGLTVGRDKQAAGPSKESDDGPSTAGRVVAGAGGLAALAVAARVGQFALRRPGPSYLQLGERMWASPDPETLALFGPDAARVSELAKKDPRAFRRVLLARQGHGLDPVTAAKVRDRTFLSGGVGATGDLRVTGDSLVSFLTGGTAGHVDVGHKGVWHSVDEFGRQVGLPADSYVHLRPKGGPPNEAALGKFIADTDQRVRSPEPHYDYPAAARVYGKELLPELGRLPGRVVERIIGSPTDDCRGATCSSWSARGANLARPGSVKDRADLSPNDILRQASPGGRLDVVGMNLRPTERTPRGLLTQHYGRWAPNVVRGGVALGLAGLGAYGLYRALRRRRKPTVSPDLSDPAIGR